MPALFVTEAANVISRAVKVGVITPQECESSFDLLHAMQASIEPIDLTQSAMPLAITAFEEGLSAYVATYLLLAKKLLPACHA